MTSTLLKPLKFVLYTMKYIWASAGQNLKYDLCDQWKNSLGIGPVLSESLLCTQWVAKDASFLHATSKDFDQTGQILRLISVFTGCTAHIKIMIV